MTLRKRVSPSQVAMLRRVPALRSRTDKELAEIVPLVDQLTVPEGTVLAREGATAQEAFVVVEGWAAVMVHGEPVGAVRPGEFIGELAMLDRGPRTATVVAKTPMHLLVVGPQAWSVFSEKPVLASAMAKVLAQRLRRAEAPTGKAGT